MDGIRDDDDNKKGDYGVVVEEWIIEMLLIFFEVV